MASTGNKPFSGIAQALALVTELGFAISIPIALGALLGSYLDQRYSGRGVIFVVVFLLGLASGLYNGYWLLRKAVEQTK